MTKETLLILLKGKENRTIFDQAHMIGFYASSTSQQFRYAMRLETNIK